MALLKKEANMKITDQTVTPFNIYVAEYFKDPLPAMIYQQILYECTKGYRESFRHSETQCAVAQMSINDFYTRFPRRDIRTIHKALRLLLDSKVIMSDLYVPDTKKSLRFTISPDMPKELRDIEMNSKFLKQFVKGYKVSNTQKSFAEENISGMYYPRTLYMQEYGMLPGIIFDRLFFLMIIQRNIPGFIPEYLPKYNNVALRLTEKKLNELFPFLKQRNAYDIITNNLIEKLAHINKYDTSLYGINYVKIINDSVPYYNYASHWEAFKEYLNNHKETYTKKQAKIMKGISSSFAEEYVIPQNKAKEQKESIDKIQCQVKSFAVNNTQHTEIIGNNFTDTEDYDEEGHFVQDYMDATRCYLAEYEGVHIPYDPYELPESFLLLNLFLVHRNTEKFDENYLKKINLPVLQYIDNEFNITQPENSTENLRTHQETLPENSTSDLRTEHKTRELNIKPENSTENLRTQHGAIIIRDIKNKKDIKGSRDFFFTNYTVGQISAKFAHCFYFFRMLNSVPAELVKPVIKEKKKRKEKDEKKIIATGITSCDKNLICDLNNFENMKSIESQILPSEIISLDLFKLKKFYYKIFEKCRFLEIPEYDGKNGRIYHTLPKHLRFAVDMEMLKRDAINILCLYPWEVQVLILTNVLLLTPERLHDKWADDYGKAYVQSLYAILHGRIPTTELKCLRPVTLPPELAEIAFKGIPQKEHKYITFYDIRRSLELAGHPYEANAKYLIPSPRVYPGIKEYEHVRILAFYVDLIKRNLFEI